MNTRFKITLKQEVFHTLEIDVNDYIRDANDVKETCELYHRIANNPMAFVNDSDESIKEMGEVTNISIDVSEQM